MEPLPENPTFKIVVVGPCGAGKTSIIQQYVHGKFEPVRETIGLEFAIKTIECKDMIPIQYQIWDIAGQERFGAVTQLYYRNTFGAFLVTDITRDDFLEAALKWKKDLNDKSCLEEDNGPLPVILLVNKIDLVTKEYFDSLSDQIQSFCDENKIDGWVPVTAKDGRSIKIAGLILLDIIFERVSPYWDLDNPSTWIRNPGSFMLAPIPKRDTVKGCKC